ncbi:MAG: hypothetical protein QOD75_115 [Blastocatellia bacterium]|jgi:hypothetical protein|nr:hypothetical protein [Blastocatellia bacterium]
MINTSPPSQEACKVIAEIKAREFDGTIEAKQLSLNFTGFDAIVRAVGINKASLQKYCQIVIGLAKGRTGQFQCSDLTVGARYFYGEGWNELSEKDRLRCTNQGRRLNERLSKIAPDLITRTVPPGKPAFIQAHLINLILRVGKLTELGYSANEAAGLLEIPISLIAPKRKGRSKHAKHKTIKTLAEQINAEDPDLLSNHTGGVFIHESLKCNSLDLYRMMGITAYKLRLLDDQLNIPAMDLDPDFEKAIVASNDKKQSLILTHTAPHVLQLDDCDAEVVGRIMPHCFEVVQTSPGSFHCRLALPIGTRQASADSVKRRLLKSLSMTGSCNGGGGKTFRLPGSTNFKPEKGNRIIRILAQEKFTSIAELSLANLIPYEHRSAPANGGPAIQIPIYSRVKTYRDHTSSARDFNFCRQAASWGVPRKRIIAELLAASTSAAEKGRQYVERTVDKAIRDSRRWSSSPKQSG